MMLMKVWWAFSWAPSPTGLFGWPAVPSTRGAKSEVKCRPGPGDRRFDGEISLDDYYERRAVITSW